MGELGLENIWRSTHAWQYRCKS